MMKNVRKILKVLICFCLLQCLTGCDNKACTIDEESVMYNAADENFSILFVCLDENGESIRADIKGDICIINDNNEMVYNDKFKIKKSELETYTNEQGKIGYYAKILLPAESITKGYSPYGLLTMNIKASGYQECKNIKLEIKNNLPLKDCAVTIDEKTVTLSNYYYITGELHQTMVVENIAVSQGERDKSIVVTFDATLTYGKDGDGYSYKIHLYDENDELVESKSCLLYPMNVNEKVVGESVTFYNLEPGKSYKLVIADYE